MTLDATEARAASENAEEEIIENQKNQIIEKIDALIAEAIAEGYYTITFTTTLTRGVKRSMQYYEDLGYTVKLDRSRNITIEW